MTFHKWVMKAWKGGSGGKQVNKDPSREGNPVTEGDGKTGMEYKQVKGKPEPARKLDWGD